MIGLNISHYKILEKLGEGGMGVVYKAEDTKLKRTVALKFLPPELTRDPEAKARFIREAQAASSLDHPNIYTIYEIDETKPAPGEPGEGQLFIVMACYEGMTLKEKIKDQRLKIKEAIDYAIQIAQGLAKAHEKGIVHRDIKPANIFITTDGIVKILDFGLAKLTGQAQVTKDASTLGTVAYMSPEQLSGKEVDQRTDIWSLGVILYEMLCGEPPFKGEYEQAVVYSILNDTPKSVQPNIDADLERIVNVCLAKNATSRYQQMTELMTDLRSLDLQGEFGNAHSHSAQSLLPRRWLPYFFGIVILVLVLITGYFWFLQKPPPGHRQSIAVLPFINLSDSKEDEYFSDGVTEEIINNLTHIRDLRVIARTSSFAFKDKQEDVREIGKKLDVEHLLEGSIRRAGNKLRITAQLVKVSDGSHIWSEKFDREFEDVFAIQDEIALAIVDKLQLDLLPLEHEHLIKRNTDNINAYNDYLKGHFFWNKRTAEGFEKSIQYYQSALQRDPEFVLPYTGLADVYASLGWYDFRPKKEVFAIALSYATKALEIDDQNGQAHATMGNYKAWCEYDWNAAEKEYQQALQLNPSDAETHHQLAHIFELRGLFEQAIEEMQIAVNLEPFTVNFNTCLGQILFYAGQLERANKVLHRSLEIDSTYFWSYYWLGRVYHASGKVEDALRILKKAGKFPSIQTISLGTSSYIYARLGHTGQVLKILDQLLKMSEDQIVDPLYISWIYLGLNDWENTFYYLDQAYEGLSSYLPMIKVDSFYDTLHTDVRFRELLRKMGLENEKTSENKK